jgi:hypothetical protein
MELKTVIKLNYNIRECLKKITDFHQDIAALNSNIIVCNLGGDLFNHIPELSEKISQKELQITLQKQQIKQLIIQLNEQI